MKPKIIWFTPVYIEYNNRKKNIDIYIYQHQFFLNRK